MNSLLIVTESHQPADASVRCAQALVTDWPVVHRPTIKAVTTDEFRSMPTEAIEACVIWLQLNTAPARVLDEALNRAYELQTATLLSTKQDPENHIDDCVMALGPDATDRETELCLRTLMTQTAAIQSLRAEERILRRQQASTARQISQIDEELRLAAQLQKQFVPQSLPTLGGFDFRVLWRPAGYVSGDVYDVQRLDEKHIGVFMADAVGHGVPAALMTMFIKRSLRTKVLDTNSNRGYRLVEPNEAIASLNTDLYGQNIPGQTRFATACYAVIDTETGQSRFARAGHPYPMILRQNGETEYLKADGGLLGLFETDEFEQTEFVLRPGDRMLIYSDGFEFAFPDATSDKIANEDYLKRFETLRKGTPDEGIHQLTQLMERQAGSLNQRDDLTLIYCDYQEQADVLPTTDIPSSPPVSPHPQAA